MRFSSHLKIKRFKAMSKKRDKRKIMKNCLQEVRTPSAKRVRSDSRNNKSVYNMYCNALRLRWPAICRSGEYKHGQTL